MVLSGDISEYYSSIERVKFCAWRRLLSKTSQDHLYVGSIKSQPVDTPGCERRGESWVRDWLTSVEL